MSVAIVLVADLETICRLAGKVIQRRREQSGETPAQFAARIGVELSLVERLESGDVRTHQELAFAFEDFEDVGAAVRDVDKIEQTEVRGESWTKTHQKMDR